MKLIYSHLQKFLPDLKVKPQQLRDDLTMIGHFTNYFEEIDNEIIFDLDIKVNRGDCLGYYGLARDLSILYNLPLVNLAQNLPTNSSLPQLPITITTDKVKRVMAIKLTSVNNQISPDWLQTFIKLHGTNPVNLIVDLTNYAMFMYGIPNHAFDIKKSGENLIWEINPKYDQFTSLDGSILKLNSDILMINNPDKALSLSFWGGEACAIDLDTTDIIIEMAVYNPTTVRQNSRFLKTTTEASTRLEKNLDSNTIPQAFNFLINLILKHSSAKIASQVFDHYLQVEIPPKIKFDLNLPSQISGINVPIDFTLNCLNQLNPSAYDSKSTIYSPPSIRKDLINPQSLANEAIRFWGYDKIPTDKPLAKKEVDNITPSMVYLIDSLKDQLIQLSYDEVLTWPLVSSPLDPQTVVKTQNSINTEVVYLRQSLIPSLQNQLDQYNRFKLPQPQFFEINKIYFQIDNNYIEKTALALYHPNPTQLKSDLAKLNLSPQNQKDNFAEIILDDLPKPTTYQPQLSDQTPAIELKTQIITLDANVVLDQKNDPLDLIKKYTQIIGEEFLWELIITDIYQDPKTNKYRYTFQASYFNLDDKTAKNIHLKAFSLK